MDRTSDIGTGMMGRKSNMGNSYDADTDSDDKPKKSDAEKLLEKARECFKLALEAETEQRKREQEDLRFQVGDNQWDDAAKAERDGGVSPAGKAIPPRPRLSISLLHQPQQLVKNQAANARLAVELHPVSEDADQELAEVKQGLYRRIERDGQADLARLWALDRAIQCGRGWYRVVTRMDEDGDNPFDQEIGFERILYQSNVYMDPSAERADYSDAEWAFVAGWVPFDAFKRAYPKANVSRLQAGDKMAWAGLEKEAPDWVRSEGEGNAILVADYFYKEHEDYTVCLCEDGQIRDEEDMPEGMTAVREMTLDRVKVKLAQITAADVLADQYFPSDERPAKYIPLIPVTGRELQPVDKERRWEGMVRPARDGQKLYNFAASTLVERMALEPKTPFIGAEGQFEGHEAEWEQANTRNQPYLEYKPQGIDGKPAPPPQRAQIDGSGMSLALMALQEGKNFVQSATAVYEPSLGNSPRNRDSQSGRAILALQGQTDAGTSNFVQNLASISLPYEARVVLDLMPAIYDRPGRITRVLGAEDDVKTVMLGRMYQEGQDGDRPMPMMGPNRMPMPPPQPGQPMPQGAKYIDLSKGKYAISVSIGKSHQSRLEQGAADIGEILAADPTLMPIIGDLYFKFRDFPGHTEIAERLKRMREMNPATAGLSDQPGKVSPEAAQAQAQAAAQQVQVLQQQLAEATKALETERAKQEALIQKAQIDAETKLSIETMKEQNKFLMSKMQTLAKILSGSADRQVKVDQQHEQMAHEVAMAETVDPYTQPQGADGGMGE